MRTDECSAIAEPLLSHHRRGPLGSFVTGVPLRDGLDPLTSFILSQLRDVRVGLINWRDHVRQDVCFQHE